jgi:hypothetical protein
MVTDGQMNPTSFFVGGASVLANFTVDMQRSGLPVTIND